MLLRSEKFGGSTIGKKVERKSLTRNFSGVCVLIWNWTIEELLKILNYIETKTFGIEKPLYKDLLK